MTMTIAAAIAEIDRLRDENAKLAATVAILRTERNTWRTESGR